MVDQTESTGVNPSPNNDDVNEPSTAELVSRLSGQSSRLIRGQVRLAIAEISQKVKHAGVGAGAFGVAGTATLFGLGVLITTAILALNLVLPAWLAALIVAVALLMAAASAGLIGKRQVRQATPPLPQRSIDSVKRDVDAVRGNPHHDDPS
jgi:Putative Actinobacterial Holin-X, holin superfamily III